jgi:hypothetical protein
MSGIDVLKLLTDGTIKKMAIDDAADRAKAGTLRGGSGGWMSEDFKYCTGTCPRKAWARYKGYTLEDNSDKLPMFQGGRLSEDGVCEILEHSWPNYKREEEVPTSWSTTNGLLVTGRPDIVLCDNGVPCHGLELKLICSLWTALDVLVAPKVDHIIQAAHYSKQLNVPYTIVYVNRTNWSLLSDFALKKIPKEGDVGSEVIDYKWYKTKVMEDGKAKEIKYRAGKDMKPFYRTYNLRWDTHGQVEVNLGGDNWVTTFVTWSGIERFYNYISTMDERGHCGPVPTPVDISGDSKSYKACAYCNLKEHGCGKANLPLDKFKEICDSVQAVILFKRGELTNTIEGDNT